MIPKISIIVPVYNTEKYLDRCIQSILAQTYINFELLLVDDGSTDSSSAICDQYAEQDSRIRVFHKENGGASSARNIGLDNAQGEWITFVDSDDMVKNDYLYAMISHPDADLIVSSFEFLDKIEDWDNSISNKFYKKQEIKYFIDRYTWSVVLCATVCKLFKTTLIGLLRFNDNISSKEDTIFTFEYLTKVNTIRTIENWGYQYRRGLNESLSTKSLSHNECLYIIKKYSKSFKRMEASVDYQGQYVRVANNSILLDRCLCAIRDGKTGIFQKYKDFIKVMKEDDIKEVITYKDKYMNGIRRRSFDFFARCRLYPILFIYILTYKGTIY